MSSTVSLVMPLKDGERFLAEALESVIAQSRPPDEILVVEGGSRDRSREIASSFEQVTLLDQPGSGITNAWNHGVRQSTGSLIAFLDSDDRWLPGKLEAQVAMLERRPELPGVIGLVRHFQEPGYEPRPAMRLDLLEGEYMAQMPSALLVRRETFDRVGLFDEDYRIAADIDWFARFKDLGLEWGELDQLVLEKRYHDTNLSVSEARRNNHEMARLLRRSIERQRGER
jgi:glycosyltransferase involved in cell wall biosynthesis